MKYNLGDIVEVEKKTINPQKTPNDHYCVYSLPGFDNGKTPERLTGSKILSNKIIIDRENYILFNKLNLKFKRVWRFKNDGENNVCSTEFLPLYTINNDKVDLDYLYYSLINDGFYARLVGQNSGTSNSHQRIHKEDLLSMEIDLPDLELQQEIVRILSVLDKKIELNNQKNGTYFNICRSLLNSYLSAENLEEHDLNEFLNVFTGKRNANETSPDGKYVFFSCAPEPLKSDTYIFDGSAIIIAGNGAYTGRTRFYEGKMELYQRTYACTPKNNDIQPLTYGFYVYMKNKFEQEKMGGTHGSAIPYIVMGDITKYKILYDKKLFEKFSTQVKPFIKAIRENEDENISLASLRDTLLPRLVSGVIDLSKVTAE